MSSVQYTSQRPRNNSRLECKTKSLLTRTDCICREGGERGNESCGWVKRESSINQIRKEGNVLFNDALNTFYLRLYGVAHMVKDHLVCQETRCRHMAYSFRLAARVLLYAPDRVAHTTAFVTPVVEHWLKREIDQWIHTMKDRSDDPSHHERTL